MFKNLLEQKGLTIDRLQTFCLVAEAGGISKAARGEATRMSLYSRQIKELEEFFGVDLKDSHPKPFRLTENGRELARIAREQLRSLSDFKETCAAGPVQVRLAAANTVIHWLLLPAMRQLQESLDFARLSIRHMRADERIRAAGDLTVDFAIGREDALNRRVEAATFGTIGYSLFVSRSLAPDAGESDADKLLEKLPLALTLGGRLREALDRAAERKRLILKPAIECTSFLVGARLVQSGHYAAVLPDLAAAELDPREFRQLPLNLLKKYRMRLALCWHPRLDQVFHFAPRARAVLSNLLKKEPKPVSKRPRA